MIKEITYRLLIYDIKRAKSVSNVMQKEISKIDANKILGDNAATINCERGRYIVKEKRLFIFNEVLFIVADCEKQK